MMKDDIVYLSHMLDMAQKIAEKLKAVTRQEYDDNEDLRMIFVHRLQIIGEAAGQISQRNRYKHNRIPWEQIIGMRNRIVHDYVNVRYGIVCDVISRDIPPLMAKVRTIVQVDD